MVTLYAACVGDLRPDDFVIVDGPVACGWAFRPCGGEAATGHNLGCLSGGSAPVSEEGPQAFRRL
jgi:hypothetical protein